MFKIKTQNKYEKFYLKKKQKNKIHMDLFKHLFMIKIN